MEQTRLEGRGGEGWQTRIEGGGSRRELRGGEGKQTRDERRGEERRGGGGRGDASAVRPRPAAPSLK